MAHTRFPLQPALDAAYSAERAAALAFGRSRAVLERARAARLQAVHEERSLRLAAPAATRAEGERFVEADRAYSFAREQLERAISARRGFEMLRAAFDAGRRRRALLRDAAAFDEQNTHRPTSDGP